ncbi:MAG: flagellar hook-length control protein FliK [Nitrospira sp.]|nr:flagellar hook-length control protein FliK [Nitrospira sp.]
MERKSHHPLISHEPIESFSTSLEAKAIGGRSSLSHVDTVSDFSSTQQSKPAEPRTNDDESGVQDAERETEEVIKGSGRVATDRGGSVPVSQDSILRSPRSPQDPNIPLQVVQDHVRATSLDGNGIVANDKAANHEGRQGDYSVSSQASRPVQSLGDQDALGASTEQSSSHGRQPGNNGSGQLSELWSRHNGRQMETAEPKISQPFVVDHTVAHGSVAPGVSSQPISVPGTPPPAPIVTQVQSGLPAEEMAQPAVVPGMRSVVVNVVQPDLGHVNIRVAMTNDVVHTHFSSDRLEVGQFLINGQDRLQAALQASGLDLGQFRVDIDRQSGGRSFQQGSSQEQGQLWSQGSHGMGQEPHSEQPGQTRGTLHGLLNVVA